MALTCIISLSVLLEFPLYEKQFTSPNYRASTWLFIIACSIFLIALSTCRYLHPKDLLIDEDGIYFYNRKIDMIYWNDIHSIVRITKKNEKPIKWPYQIIIWKRDIRSAVNSETEKQKKWVYRKIEQLSEFVKRRINIARNNIVEIDGYTGFLIGNQSKEYSHDQLVELLESYRVQYHDKNIDKAPCNQ